MYFAKMFVLGKGPYIYEIFGGFHENLYLPHVYILICIAKEVSPRLKIVSSYKQQHYITYNAWYTAQGCVGVICTVWTGLMVSIPSAVV